MEKNKATQKKIEAVKRELNKQPIVRCAVNPERGNACIVK